MKCGENGYWCHGTCGRHGRCMYLKREHRGGPRPNAGRPRLPRLTADEATALLRELAPDARTPAEVARALGCRPERVREALRGGCTVATAERWQWAAYKRKHNLPDDADPDAGGWF